MKLRDRLNEQKRNGVCLDFDNLDREMMYQLWHVEIMSDRDIAELFNVRVKDVNDKRTKEFNLFFDNCVTEDILRETVGGNKILDKIRATGNRYYKVELKKLVEKNKATLFNSHQ